MRYFLSIIYILMFLITLQAQEDSRLPSTFHLKFGAGLGYQTVRDDAMSPLLYDGSQIGAYTGAEWRTSKGIWQLDGLFWLGENQAERSGATTDNYIFAVNGSYLVYLSEATWQLALGGALTSWGSFREHLSLINSDYFYDVFFSVAPSAALYKGFRLLNRSWEVSWQLTVPVLTYGLRPNYAGLNEAPPDDNSFADELDAARIGSFDILTNVKSRLELLYPLQNGNRIGLLYYWDFYNANIEPHTVRQAMQSVQLNLQFSLSRPSINGNKVR